MAKPHRVYDTRKQAPGERWTARRTLAVRLRKAIDQLIRREISPEEIESIGEVFEGMASKLGAMPQVCGRAQRKRIGEEEFRNGILEFAALTGHSNSIAPPMTLWTKGESGYATLEFGAAYEGIPGCVHAGYVSAVFDHVLGYTQAVADPAGFTARLQITHHRTVPLDTKLRAEAWVDRVDGRRKFCLGKLFVCTDSGEELAAEAQGVFMAIPGPEHPLSKAE